MIKISESDLLEPSKVYTLQLKQAFHDNIVEYFNKLVKDSKVNKEENKELVKKFHNSETAFASKQKELNKLKAKKSWAMFDLVLLCFIIIGFFFIFKVKKNFNEQIAKLEKEVSNSEALVNKSRNDCIKQMSPLFALFDYNMAVDIFTMTTPLIQMDKTFDPAKYSLLHENYGYEENYDDDVSTLFVQSGSILGNPFLIEKNYNQSMRNHLYEGELVIHYSRTVKTKDGYTTIPVTETLRATVNEPEPWYYKDTWLIFGSDAAPDLSFSRKKNPSVSNLDDKGLEKYCKKFSDSLDKKVRKEIGNDSFTRLSNTEFEAMFNALDRDHETQFRLLFTPLAQKNMISLLRNKDKTGYGDNFNFYKRKKLNYILADHLQGENVIDASPEAFMNFDFQECEKFFIEYMDNFVKKLFFGLAPLLSIPLYQQHKAKEYIYKDTYKGNVTKGESEACANSYAHKIFAHPATAPLADTILKSYFQKKDGKTDEVTVRAHSFSGTNRVTIVPTLGGDGKMHGVPVPWIEYDKIVKDTPMRVQPIEASYPEYQSGKYNDIIDKFGKKDNIIYRKRFISSVK